MASSLMPSSLVSRDQLACRCPTHLLVVDGLDGAPGKHGLNSLLLCTSTGQEAGAGEMVSAQAEAASAAAAHDARPARCGRLPLRSTINRQVPMHASPANVMKPKPRGRLFS